MEILCKILINKISYGEKASDKNFLVISSIL